MARFVAEALDLLDVAAAGFTPYVEPPTWIREGFAFLDLTVVGFVPYVEPPTWVGDGLASLDVAAAGFVPYEPPLPWLEPALALLDDAASSDALSFDELQALLAPFEIAGEEPPVGAPEAIPAPLPDPPPLADGLVFSIEQELFAEPVSESEREERRVLRVERRREARHRIAVLGLVLTVATIVSPLIAVFSPAHVYVVASGSMDPAIPMGSLVFATPGTPEIGDIVVYWTPMSGPQVHRVLEAYEIDGKPYYRTAGDANPSADSVAIQPKDILGVVTFHLPYAGHLWLMSLDLQVGLFCAFLAGYLAITAWDARHLIFKRRHAWLGVMLVLILLAPGAMGSVTTTWPTSTHTIDAANTSLPFSAGTMGSASLSSNNNVATTTSTTPTLYKEIVMWGCYDDETTPTESCDPCINVEPYDRMMGSLTKVNVADYAPAPNFILQVDFYAPSSSTAYVSLYDEDGAATVSGTEVSTTSTSRVVVESSSFTLSGDKAYTFQMKQTSGSCAGEVFMVKLLATQTYPTETTTQHRLGSASKQSGTSFGVIRREVKWLYEASQLDGITAAYFEAVAKVDSGQLAASSVKLVDTTTTLGISTLSVATTDTSWVRLRSSDIKASLTDGRVYNVELATGTTLKNVFLSLARIIIVQETFTKTIDYTDISTRHTTTSTSYVEKGSYSRVHMETQWDQKLTYFEATMHETGLSDVAYARLYDRLAGAAVSGSEITSTGTSRTRVRSGDITNSMNLLNANYNLEIKATVDATFESSFLVTHLTSITGGRTDDHILKSTNNAACTWEYNLSPKSISNLGRMTKSAVALRVGSEAATEKATALDVAKYGADAAWNGQYVYVFGGNHATGGKKIIRYDPATDTKAEMTAQFASVRQDIRVVWTGTYFFIFGGTVGGASSNLITRYDPATDTLTDMTAVLPTARTGGAAFWTGTYAYYVGGTDAGGKLDDFVKYDPAADSATLLSVVLAEATQWPRAVYDPILEKAYIMGGTDACCATNRIVKFDPVAETVTTLAARLPFANHHHTAVFDGGYAYILGGKDASNVYQNDIVRFDTKWETVETRRTTLPSIVGRMAAAITPYGIYTFGGRDEGSGSTYDDLVQYTGPIAAARFDSTDAATLPTARSGTSSVWTGTYFFNFGGTSASGDLSAIVRYDPVNNVVKTMTATLPTARQYTSAVWTGTYAYIFGGTGATRYDDILRYDPSADTITDMAQSLPSARHATSAVWTGSVAYVFGGYDGAYLDTIVKYDPTAGSVTTMAEVLPTTRRWTSAVWTGSAAYIFGGTNGNENDDIVKYDPTAASVTLMSETLPSSSYANAAAWDGTYAWIFGGYDGTGYLDDLVRYNPATGQVTLMSTVLPSSRRYVSAAFNDDFFFVFGGHGGSYLDEIVRYDPIADAIVDVETHPRYTGATFRVAASGTLQDLVFTDPASSGTSSFTADLEGKCVGSGVSTKQPVTYEFG